MKTVCPVRSVSGRYKMLMLKNVIYKTVLVRKDTLSLTLQNSSFELPHPTSTSPPPPPQSKIMLATIAKRKTCREIFLFQGELHQVRSHPARLGEAGHAEMARQFERFIHIFCQLSPFLVYQGSPWAPIPPEGNRGCLSLVSYCGICLESEESIVNISGLILFLAKCDRPCLNGGFCISPNHCQCQPGYHGDVCERGLLWL